MLRGNRRAGRNIIVLLLFLAVFSILVTVLTVSYAYKNNTLLYDDRWLPTSKNCDNMVSSTKFFTEGQALAGNTLNLGVWGGYNEVLYKTPITLAELSCKFIVQNNGYLCVIFDHQSELSWCIRLTSNQQMPNALIGYDVQGRFHSFTPVQVPQVTPNEWHSLQLIIRESEVEVVLDKQGLAVPTRIDQRPGRFGFRNGSQGASVDDIRAVDRASKNVYFESFNGIQHWARSLRFVFPRVLLSLAVILVMGWSILKSWRTVVEYSFVIMLTLITCGIVYGLFQFFVLAKLYPNRTPEWHISEELVRIHASSMRTECDVEGKRILFLGTSQTQGLGANTPTECYVAVLESLLNNACKRGCQIHCVNGGLGGFIAKEVAMVYREFADDCHADITVVDLGCNDSWNRASEGNYESDLETLARNILAHGSKLILVLEPACPEQFPDGWVHNVETRRVGTKLNVPVIDAHAYLKSKSDTGFLFWDYVHPTSYGHGLIAECLLEAILQDLDELK